MQDELLKRLDALAAKLGTTADHLWHVLIRQSYIEGIEDTLLGVTSIFVSVYLVGQFLKEHKSWDEDLLLGFRILLVLALIAVFIVGITALYSAPSELGNPEYRALSEVLKALGK